MKSIVKIYKNLMSEEDRLRSLEMFNNYPNSILTQSICTDESVFQLREYIPLSVVKQLYTLHSRIIPVIEKDFQLHKDNINLMPPNYMKTDNNELITVDKRIAGMLLPMHRDIPTGDYAGHFGLEGGMTSITMTGIFYWNDDFDGGELRFDDPTLLSFEQMDVEDRMNQNVLKDPYVYKPVAGDFVVFPSYLYHEILEMGIGERYSSQYFFNRTNQYNVSELPNNDVHR